MQEVSEGMNAVELQEFKASLLKAERLEILEILREAENLDAAIEAIRQRKNGQQKAAQRPYRIGGSPVQGRGKLLLNPCPILSQKAGKIQAMQAFCEWRPTP